MSSLPGILDRIRRPEYTGENRCVPCTVVNVAIAVVLAGVVVVAIGPLVAGVVLAASLASIYLRGYLVPGTPTLTKRYFPDRVLAWFDKAEGPAAVRAREAGGSDEHGAAGTDSADTDSGESADANSTDSTDSADSAETTDPDAADIDPEALLLSASAVEPCEHEDDLCLTDAFRDGWLAGCRELRGEDARARLLAELLDLDDPGTVSFEPAGGRAGVFDGDRRVGAWLSEGAMVADLAADRLLVDRSAEWAALPVRQRLGVMPGLRSFLDTCPLCDGPVTPTEDTVESCCRSWDVVSVGCTDCGIRLLEIDPETHEFVSA